MRLRQLIAAALLVTGLVRPAPARAEPDGNPWQSRDLSRSDVEPALRRGADYLERELLPSGQFVYLEDPLGRCCRTKGDRYSLIRHLGALYALVRAHEATGDVGYLAAAERAFAFAERFRTTGPGGPYLRGLTNQPNLGENGFLLIDALHLDHSLGTAKHAVVATGVGRFLAASLVPNGKYATEEEWAESQAVIGLVQLTMAAREDPAYGLKSPECEHMLDVVHTWLKASKEEGTKTHWSVQAAAWYLKARPGSDRELAAYALASAHSILKGVAAGSDGGPSRLVGARGGKLYSCNATARAEGLLAALDVARALGRSEEAGFFLTRAREHVAYGMQFQYGTEGSLADKDPVLRRTSRLFSLNGGVMDDPQKAYVRIDYVAHLVRAMVTYLETPDVPRGVGLTMDELL